jgi:uncharacterized membrane protein YedE/YeeE
VKDALLIVPGFLFGVGLALSGMTNPKKVVDFLDVTGAWDPSLALVMVGAIGAFAILNALVHKKREEPVLCGELPGPRSEGEVDRRLLAGATLFGVGWGLSGVCPGPALANLSTLTPELLAFLVAMVGGMLAAQRVFAADAPPLAEQDAEETANEASANTG